MTLEKLKDSARKYEQKEDWRKAIEVYLKAIQTFESGKVMPDLSLYNRLGDLHMKVNEPAQAVKAYERAVDLYAEQGFANNAIALCGKILRVNPGRTQTYLKLAQLHARKNVVNEAKKHLLEYLERMNAHGGRDEAVRAVMEFAHQFEANEDIRVMLSEILRAAARDKEAKAQLEKLAEELEARGDRAGARRTRAHLHAIEEDVPPPADTRTGDLVFLDTGLDLPKFAQPPAQPRGPRPTVRVTPPVEEPAPEPAEDDALVLEPTALGAEDAEVAESLEIEPTALGAEDTEVAESLEIEPTALAGAADADDSFDELLVDGVTQQPGEPSSPSELTIEHTSLADFELEVSQLDEAEPVSDEAAVGPIVPSAVQGLVSDLTIDLDMEEVGLEPTALEVGGGAGAEDLIVADEPAEDLGVVKDFDWAAPEPAADSDAGLAFVEASEPALPTVADLEDRILDDPDNPEHHRMLGEALIAEGDANRGIEELNLALEGYETQERWDRATDVVTELIRVDPARIGFYQKRVELAYRRGEKSRLVDAYLELGDALLRSGALDKAVAVYQRVAEHDPTNQRAATALGALGPVEEAPAPAPAPKKKVPKGRPSAPVPQGDFVDLGALVLETEAVERDTRMRVEDEQPTGDEARDFEEMLQQFKRGIEENLEAEDFQAHYDLGVAFKEMGLLDEAIAEFQKALRSPDPEGRLRTSEALGTAFFEKGQYPVAEAILRRAVESLPGQDDGKIGLIYWLGRALEAQSREADARAFYQRALAVDIRFMDLADRLKNLPAGPAR